MTGIPTALAQGYQRFRSGTFVPDRARYGELASAGQSPAVMVVSCCDSRVDPEAIFGAGPGELFVVRNVANLVPPREPGNQDYSVSSALEFAVLNLKVSHILVMGHAKCGGISAALSDAAAQQTEARPISSWISVLEPTTRKVQAAHQASDPATMQTALEREAIKTSLANLRTYPFIADLEKTGSLTMHGAHFDIGSGVVTVLNQDSGDFETL